MNIPSYPGSDPPAPEAKESRARGADGIPLIWEVGDLILDRFEVIPWSCQKTHAEGGFGRVHRIRDRKPDSLNLAVKSVHPDKLKHETAVADFKREAEVWVRQIGLHRHVVACEFVMVLGGLPRIFVEFVEGGSLQEWIASGKLYEGGSEVALGRILDILIQVAWGLRYTHEQGVIHQDIKPGNVLLTADGIAKLTDFGLAAARARAFGEETSRPTTTTVLATWGGLTQAYCSPEQSEIGARIRAQTPKEPLPPLTRRTDIWSWAVSALEMFQGLVAWPSGSVADRYLNRQVEDSRIPSLPAGLRDLLSCCLRRRPEDRPHDLKLPIQTLRQIYQDAIGQPYPRDNPPAAVTLAETLNNRAISLCNLDMCFHEEALRLWQRALEVHPRHAASTFNVGLILWHKGKMSRQVLKRCLEDLVFPSQSLSDGMKTLYDFDLGLAQKWWSRHPIRHKIDQLPESPPATIEHSLDLSPPINVWDQEAVRQVLQQRELDSGVWQGKSQGVVKVVGAIRLRGMNGSIKGRVWESMDLLRIGRLEPLEIVLDDSSVSRYHAEVRHTERGWRIKELGSTNGTRLNGVRLGPGSEWPLRLKDMIQCGEIALVVEYLTD